MDNQREGDNNKNSLDNLVTTEVVAIFSALTYWTMKAQKRE